MITNSDDTLYNNSSINNDVNDIKTRERITNTIQSPYYTT